MNNKATTRASVSGQSLAATPSSPSVAPLTGFDPSRKDLSASIDDLLAKVRQHERDLITGWVAVVSVEPVQHTLDWPIWRRLLADAAIALIPSPDQGEATQHLEIWKEEAARAKVLVTTAPNRLGWNATEAVLRAMARVVTPPVDSAKPGEGDPVILITVESEHERAIFTFVDRAQSEIFLADCRKRNAFHVTAIDERATTTAARAAEGLDEMLENDNAA